MKVRNVLTGLAASVALITTVAAPTMASQTFASATSIFSVFNYSSTDTGVVKVTPANTTKFTSTGLPGFNDTLDTLSFTGLQNQGDAILEFGILATQQLGGGTFALKQGATTLLSGNFSFAELQAIVNIGNKAASVSFFGVNYTGGTYWTAAQSLGFLNPGDLSLALLSNTNLTTVSVGGGNVRIGGFNASGTGTFGAEEVLPEPGTVVPFVIGVLGLGVLVFRGRKAIRVHGAAV